MKTLCGNPLIAIFVITNIKVMAKGFGNTWWGSRWLLSLTHIDYENRIPRGATYARAGAVREIKVKGNVISAKVEGRRPRPYSVTIIVPPFFPEDVERLIQGIMERPDIVSKLLKHELDPAVMLTNATTFRYSL